MVVDAVWGLDWKWLSRWIRRTGALFLERFVAHLVKNHEAWTQEFDLVHIDEVALVSSSLVQQLRERFGPVSCYVIDDPFGDRDGVKWRLFLDAVPEYDLITVVRQPNVKEAYDYGARDVLRVFRSADEVIHAPQDLTSAVREKWNSKVVFVGTWFPERGPFLASLINRDVPITLYGPNWEKAEEWPIIKPYWKRGTLHGADYTKALQCADICLGFLSKGNRDLHTQRSMEIPYIGSLLCAERTVEHAELYEDGEEAIFWSDADECADRCFEMIENDERREAIARRGRKKCIENGYLNESVMGQIVQRTQIESTSLVSKVKA